MSRVKRELERMEELRGVAAAIAVETGALEECPIHEDMLIDQWDDDARSHAYAIATNKFKAGEIDGTREEILEAIKSVIDDAGDECPICANNRDRD